MNDIFPTAAMPLLPVASPGVPDIDWSEVRFISLLREPGSDRARAFTQAVATSVEPHLERSRALGTAGRRTHIGRTGSVLAGLLRAAFRDLPVRAQRGKSDNSWWKGSPIGFDAFWSLANAMIAAGLVSEQLGTSYHHAGSWAGRATALYASGALMALAATHGITKGTFAEDWPLTATAQRVRPEVAAANLIKCFEIPAAPSAERQPCPFEPGQVPQVAAIRAHLERLNEHLARARIEGCQPPVLTRHFFRDVRLGGRFYAIGADTFQTTRRADRHLLRINGASVTEVDLRAAALSIILARHGLAIPPDPYAVGPLAALDRNTVKAWVTQCLNSGRVPGRWSDKHNPSIRQTPISGVARAVLAAYPALDETTSLLPDDLSCLIPLGRAGWAVGQWLAGLEAKVMETALERLMAQSVIALPLHDAMLVREGDDAQAAQEALEGAFEEVLGVRPQVRVKGCSEAWDTVRS